MSQIRSRDKSTLKDRYMYVFSYSFSLVEKNKNKSPTSKRSINI